MNTTNCFGSIECSTWVGCRCGEQEDPRSPRCQHCLVELEEEDECEECRAESEAA